MSRPVRSLALTAAALVAVAVGCSGSSGDKAGGSKQLVLTLATHDDDYAHLSFAAAVSRISGGSMRIRVVNRWRDSEPDYERGSSTTFARARRSLESSACASGTRLA